MESLIAEVNWVAVIVGAVAAFVLGWLWYSETLFAKAWRKGGGTPAVTNRPMWQPMFVQAGATFLLAWVIGVTETTNSLALAVLIVLTIAGIVKAQGFFNGKSTVAVAIDVGYIIAMAVVMIAAQAIF